MIYTPRSKLTGWRKPTLTEHERVQDKVMYGVRLEAKQSFLSRCIAVVFWFMLTIYVVFRVDSDWPLMLMLNIALSVGIFLSYKKWVRLSNIVMKLQSGEYTVLQCKPYEVFISKHFKSTAGVRVCTVYDECCAESTLCDKEYACMFRDNMDLDLLMVQCMDYFVVILATVDIEEEDLSEYIR